MIVEYPVKSNLIGNKLKMNQLTLIQQQMPSGNIMLSLVKGYNSETFNKVQSSVCVCVHLTPTGKKIYLNQIKSCLERGTDMID